MFRATPVNGPFYRGVRNTDIRARPEHLQGGYRCGPTDGKPEVGLGLVKFSCPDCRACCSLSSWSPAT